MIAQVIINSNVKNLNRIFDYNVPESLEGTICVGDRILVPFGNKKTLEEGFVIGFKEKSEFKVKDIAGIQEGYKLTQFNIELAKLMARRYFCNISDCIKLMLPPGTASKEEENRVKEKVGRFVFLKKDSEEIQFDIQSGKIKSPKHIKLLEFLMENDGVYVSDLELITEVSKAVMKTLEKHEYIEFVEKQIERNPLASKIVERDTALELNEEQKKCYEQVEFLIEAEEFAEFLLYGLTGSGKTEVYLQLIDKVIKRGKKAMLLVPEISLTPQIVNRFLARFGDCIAVLHSKLSMGERYEQWVKIKQNKAQIIIGARSAIFAPIENLGIIIIDEEHDSSYKSDMTPRYHAKEIARYLAKQNEIPLILGSATPDIISYYQAKNKDTHLLTLTKRANEAKLPQIQTVDLRNELSIGNKSMISTPLYEAIEKNLKDKKQTILFINRRGFSTFVMCRECGYVAKCPHCNISLTYHLTENRLKCHYCGYETQFISICPECKSKKIKYFGSGTERLESEIHHLFPNASTIRMDIDTVSKKNSHEEILEKFQNSNIDILIGTQMVVKGHHFPNVTLVGVITADGMLNLNDYRATEKTFQTLVQVARKSWKRKRGRKSNYSNIYARTSYN